MPLLVYHNKEGVSTHIAGREYFEGDFNNSDRFTS